MTSREDIIKRFKRLSEGDNNGEQSSKKPRRALSWRHPQFSDFTIHVLEEGNTVTSWEYHVHQVVLAGSCGYFERLFENHQEVCDSCTFEFNKLARRSFYKFLDYIYDHIHGREEKKFRLNVTEAVAVRFLASYFDCDELKSNMFGFFAKELDENNCICILNDCIVLNDELLGKIAGEFCCEHIQDLQVDDILSLNKASFEMLLKGGREKESELCSTLCYKYIKKNKVPLSSDFFQSLTCCSFMNIMSLEAAVGFSGLIGSYKKRQKKKQVYFNCTCDDKFCLEQRAFKIVAENFDQCKASDIDSHLSKLEAKSLSQILRNIVEKNESERLCITIERAGSNSVEGIYSLKGKRNGHDYYEYIRNENGRETVYEICVKNIESNCFPGSGDFFVWAVCQPSLGENGIYYIAKIELGVNPGYCKWRKLIGISPLPKMKVRYESDVIVVSSQSEPASSSRLSLQATPTDATTLPVITPGAAQTGN